MADKEKDKDKEKHAKPAGGAPREIPQEHKARAEKARKAKAAAAAGAAADTGPEEALPPPPPARLIGRFRDQITPALMEKFGYKNRLAVPRLEKVVISMGIGKFATAGSEGKGKIELAEKELGVIAGQRPIRCKSKKSVANFKVREDMDTGLKVTLRGARMYEFVDRLITLAIPRVKDFRGLDPKGFDQDGNFNFGFSEQTVFPEVSVETLQFQQGMNVTMVTTARTIPEGRELLRQFGMPFREDAKPEKEREKK